MNGVCESFRPFSSLSLGTLIKAWEMRRSIAARCWTMLEAWRKKGELALWNVFRSALHNKLLEYIIERWCAIKCLNIFLMLLTMVLYYEATPVNATGYVVYNQLVWAANQTNNLILSTISSITGLSAIMYICVWPVEFSLMQKWYLNSVFVIISYLPKLKWSFQYQNALCLTDLLNAFHSS